MVTFRWQDPDINGNAVGSSCRQKLAEDTERIGIASGVTKAHKRTYGGSWQLDYSDSPSRRESPALIGIEAIWD